MLGFDNKIPVNFLYSRYFSEGIRMAAGLAIPALVCGALAQLNIGLTLTLGALCVAMTDNPGPRSHRTNGMLWIIFLMIPVTLITQFLLPNHWLTAAWILIAGFLFSMLAVYQQRVASVGLASLIVMVICMQTEESGTAIFIHTGWLTAGGIWYLIWSSVLQRLRPYRLMQQLTGEYTAGVAEYMETRANFYSSEPHYDETYHELLREQVTLRTQREALQEVLFSESAIQKQPPVILRNLYKFYFDLNQTASQIASAFADYRRLHKQFDGTGFLEKINHSLNGLAGELKSMAFAISAGHRSFPRESVYEQTLRLQYDFESLRKDHLSAYNVEDFVSLGKIVDNLEAIAGSVRGLHYYTNHDEKLAGDVESVDTGSAKIKSNINPELYFNSFNFSSESFRHAIRVSVSMGIGYAVGLIFNISFGYWILLTLIVILKPGYTLTKQRNIDRLIGTFGGLLIAAGILFIDPGHWILIALIIIMMAIAFMFMRTKYLVSVIFTTVYLILFFQLAEPEIVRKSLSSRMIDTAIGSAIALAGFLVFPTWAKKNIHTSLGEFATRLQQHILLLADVFSGSKPADRAEIRISSRRMLTSLANSSDQFNRMLSEPKVFRGEIDTVYQFVVTAQLASSHCSALLQYAKQVPLFVSSEVAADAAQAGRHLANTVYYLTGSGEYIVAAASDEEGEADRLLKIRRMEISEGKLESDTRERLVTAKAVVDQFAHLCSLSGNLEQAAALLRKERGSDRR